MPKISSILTKSLLVALSLGVVTAQAAGPYQVRVPLSGLKLTATSSGGEVVVPQAPPVVTPVEPIETPPVSAPAVVMALANTAGVEASSFDLGAVSIGAHLSSVGLRVVNKGTAAVTFASAKFQVASPFIILGDDCAGQLAASAYCTVNLSAQTTSATQQSSPLTVNYVDGTLSVGSVSVTGTPARAEVVAVTANLSGAPNSEIKGTITLRNVSGAAFNLASPITDFSGPVQVNVSGSGTLATTGTSDYAFKIVGATPGTYQIPVTFQTKVGTGTTYSPVVTALVKVTITASSYAYHATETLYSVTVPSPYIETVNYQRYTSSMYYPVITNASTVSDSSAKALKVTVPANAVNPQLTMWGSGRDGGTITIHEGSPTGASAYLYKWTTYYSSFKLPAATLVPGKTYYVIAKEAPGYGSTISYLDMSWN